MASKIVSEERSPQTLFDILNTIPMPVLAYTLKGGGRALVFANQRCLDMFGKASTADLIDSCDGNFWNFLSPDDMELVKGNEQRVLDTPGTSVTYECHISQGDDRWQLIRVRSVAWRTTDGDPIVVDLTVGRGLLGDLDRVETLDPITGLMPMNSFFQVMQRWRRKFNPDRDESELAVLYIDVVNFRSINMRKGISAGDAFLKSVGDQLRAMFPVNAISRFDVDHFAVLIHSANMRAKVVSVRELFQEIAPKGVGFRMGASIWSDHESSPETICNRAKAACDDCRKHPGTSFSVYDEEMGRRLENTEYVISNIDEAIRNGWIRVYYQPIIRSSTGNLCGMEALARWDDPTRGLLSPAVFVGPLEESRQIWKLDLCVIKQVVERISERSQRGMTEIPISVNLSRVDFLCRDIFGEVESLVRKYDIPRHILHIEVTESAIASQEKAIVDALNRFREAGYEVWMDDFGSGYSSLNLLKDYDFDVLKLDMEFLRKDTERSRKIISSVIAMDKAIGIRTLAEGVETEEQANFLRMAGCAKMQGYLFGKPLPFDDALNACLRSGSSIEDARQKMLLDEAAYVNFLTESPLVMYDYYDGKFHILQYNRAAVDMFPQYGANGPKDFEDAVNDWNSLSGNDLDRAAVFAKKSGKVGEQSITFFGREMLFRFRCVSQVDGHCVIVASFSDMSEQMKGLVELRAAAVSVFAYYQSIFYINLLDGMVQDVVFANFSTDPEKQSVPLWDEKGECASLIPRVFDSDKSRYAAFLNLDTMRKRLEQADDMVLRDAFRTLDSDGRYRWMEHVLTFVQDSSRTRAMYGIRILDMQGLENTICTIQENSQSLLPGRNQSVSDSLWDSLVQNVPLKVFWKDDKRRFLGASNAFLDYYGFASPGEIIGKTDEDMGWHPNEEHYRDAELGVLSSGEVSRSVSGCCIARGTTRNIHATKWPIYRNGAIVGLMGCFSEDPEFGDGQEGVSSGKRDDIKEFVQDFMEYEADYRLNGRKFGAIYVKIPEAPRVLERIGRDAVRELESACMTAIANAIGYEATFANLEGGRFGILAKYRLPGELQDIASRVRASIEAIHKVGNLDVTLFADVRVSLIDELISFHDRVTSSLFRGDLGEESEGKKAPQTNMTVAWEGLKGLMDSVPIGCYVLLPDQTVEYWNHEAERLLGYASDEIVGKRCIDSKLGCSNANGVRIETDHCPAILALATGKSQTTQMFMRAKDGSDVLIRNTLSPLRDETGKIQRIVSLFVPLADGDFEHDLVKQIYEAATRDSTTCLPGRKYMESCIDDALELYRRTGRQFAVLFADVDNLHYLNNTYGHGTGDKVLRAFSLALRKFGRKTDDFCRWGGDEFVGILRLRSAEDVSGASRRFAKIAEKGRITEGGQTIDCQVSMGMTVVRDDDDRKSIVDRADRYMYEAKRNHPNRIVTDFDAGAFGSEE